MLVILNGGFGSDADRVGHCLQVRLPGPWLRLDQEAYDRSLPPMLRPQPTAGPGSMVDTDTRALAIAWAGGIAAMAATGTNIIVTTRWLDAAEGQQRWWAALHDAEVPAVWVGIRCDSATAEARHMDCGRWLPGVATQQATAVHHGVAYDFEVDTGHCPPHEAADLIARHLHERTDPPVCPVS